MLKLIKNKYQLIIFLALLITSIVFLVLSIDLVISKIWIVYIDNKREAPEIQTTMTGTPILKRMEPFAYYLGYTSIAIFGSLIGLIIMFSLFKVKSIVGKNSQFKVSWQWYGTIIIFMGLAIFFFCLLFTLSLQSSFFWMKKRTNKFLLIARLFTKY